MLLLVLLAACSTSVAANLQLKCECNFNEWNFNRLDLVCFKHNDKHEVTCEKDVRHNIPRGYQYFPGYGLYRVYRAGRTFYDARKVCQRDGGELGVPETADEVVNVFQKLLFKYKAGKQAFIGIWEQDRVDGHYVTVHGKPFSEIAYQEFAENEPNNHEGGEGCLAMYPDGLLNDDNCDKPRNFICEIAVNPPLPAGYHYAEGMGFFRAFARPRTYEEAQEACFQDGAHLAVPDSQLKVDVMWQLLDDLSPFEIFVAINDIKQEGKFVTESGTPLSSLDFLTWEPGEPNQYGGNEDCVTMRFHGSLTDINCDAKRPFVCERPL